MGLEIEDLEKKSDTIRFASKSMYGCFRDKGHKLRNVHHKGTPLTAMPRLVDRITALVLSGFLLILGDVSPFVVKSKNPTEIICERYIMQDISAVDL